MTATTSDKEGTVDLSTCDREPIHIPGAIQGHGCLLACAPGNTLVARASVNASAMLGLEGPTLINRSLADIVGEQVVHRIGNAMAAATEPPHAGFLFGETLPHAQGRYDIAAHIHLGAMIVELTRADEKADASNLSLARNIIRRLGKQTSLATLFSSATRLLRATLHYDRVMIYAFAPDGAGEVVPRTSAAIWNPFWASGFLRPIFLLRPAPSISKTSSAA